MRLLLIFISLFCITQLVAQTPGEIKDTLRCENNSTQHYALYLPKGYTDSKKIPVILFFDPGGRAQEPLLQYKALADNYNVVMACSYNCRNGSFQPSVEAAYAVLDDVEKRFSVHTSCILVSGFSGGARLASFLAVKDSQFNGVIACGATFASEAKISPNRKIPYAIVIGDHDMNFLETIKTSRYLDEIHNPYTRIEYNGAHSWPTADAFEQALLWQLVQKKMVNQEQIDQAYRKNLIYIKAAMDSGNWVRAQEQTEKAFVLFGGQLQTAKADSLLVIIKEQHNHAKEIKNFEKLWEQEDKWRNRFYEQYNKVMRAYDPDTAYKENEWSSFQHEIARLRDAKDQNKKLMGDRLFDFSWRICAEQSGQFFDQKNYKHSLLNAKIWSAMTPQNYRPWLMMAKIQATQGRDKESLQWLRKAFERGFRNKIFLEHDAAFASLRSSAAYQDLVKQYK
jgi:predicted esterase